MLLTAPAGHAQSFEPLVRQVDRSLGRIIADLPEGTGSGSGFILSPTADGRGWFYLTNHHVIEGSTGIAVVFLVDDVLFAYQGQVQVASVDLDLAVIRLERDGETAGHRPASLPLARHPVRKGQPVAAFGFPATSDYLGGDIQNPGFFATTLTTGSVSKLISGPWDGGAPLQVVQHTAAINPGSSGGPLLDTCGQVRGLNTQAAAFANDEGVAANATFWASSSVEILVFLEANNIPHARGGKQCNSGEGLPATAVLASTVLLGLAVGGFSLYGYRRRARPGLPARPAPRPDAAGPAILEARFGDGPARDLTEADLRRGIVFGRGAEARIRIEDASISRRHAELRIEGRNLMLTDLGSTNGTLVNGRRLAPRQAVQIASGARITMGSVTVLLQRPGGRT